MLLRATIASLSFFLCPTSTISAQNLVINPSFELRNPDTSGCQAICASNPYSTACSACCEACIPPSDYTDVTPIGAAMHDVNDALHWRSAAGTADFYLAGGTGDAAVPIIASGITQPNQPQFPRTNNACGGITAYLNHPSYPYVYREYLVNTLSSPLVVGQQYEVEFYALLSNESQYAISDLGVYFSVGVAPIEGQHNWSVSYNPYGAIDGQPDFHVKASTYVHGSTNWTKICGVFTADTPATHLYIGNIKNDSNTQAGLLISTNNSWEGAYYFIDDVSVKPFSGGSIDVCNRNDHILLSNDQANFKGQAIQQHNKLTWSMDMDLATDYFVLEQLKNNEFTALVTIPSNDYQQVIKDKLQYTYLHQHPPKTITYYRLKQVTTQGSIIYSSTIAVENQSLLAPSIHFYPNPTTEQLFLQLNSPKAQTIQLTYMDLLGKTIDYQTLKVDPNQAVYALSHFSDFTKGIYAVQLVDESGHLIGRHYKIVKQ